MWNHQGMAQGRHEDSASDGDAMHANHSEGESCAPGSSEHGDIGASPREDLDVVAGPGQLDVAGIDLAAARAVLVQLGTHGAQDLDLMPASQVKDMMVGLRELTAAVEAAQARAIVRLEAAIAEEVRERGETAAQAHRVARAEASLAQKKSVSGAGQSLASCRRLVRSMPGMLRALASGRVTPQVAHRVSRTLAVAAPEVRSQVDAVLTGHLGRLEACGPDEWAGAAERALHTFDPAGEAERHARAAQKSRVTMRRREHGMAEIHAVLPAIDAARIRKQLSLEAERLRAAGDRRGHQAIMVALFADLLLGRLDGTDLGGVDIGVIITDRSLLAPGHADAATIEGYGPVPYEHIRQEMLATIQRAEAAHDAHDPDGTGGAAVAMTLRSLYDARSTGELVAAESRGRAFPPGMAKLLRWSHQTCRAPYCDAPIRQLDHIHPHAAGGETSVRNGNGLSADCNQKESAGLTARVVTDTDRHRETVEWTSRLGQSARRGAIDFDPVRTAFPPPELTGTTPRGRPTGTTSREGKKLSSRRPRSPRRIGAGGRRSSPRRQSVSRRSSPQQSSPQQSSPRWSSTQ